MDCRLLFPRRSADPPSECGGLKNRSFAINYTSVNKKAKAASPFRNTVRGPVTASQRSEIWVRTSFGQDTSVRHTP